MHGKRFSKVNQGQGLKAQAIVEFAIALPVLLALVIGILEVGRLVFVYAAVTNASRNAARYASAYGLNDSGNRKYQDCAAIKDLAKKSTYLVLNVTTTISYDHQPAGTSFDTCDGNVDTGVSVATGDRVTVTVTTQFQPITKLIPIQARPITSSNSRTIMGIIDLGK